MCQKLCSLLSLEIILGSVAVNVLNFGVYRFISVATIALAVMPANGRQRRRVIGAKLKRQAPRMWEPDFWESHSTFVELCSAVVALMAPAPSYPGEPVPPDKYVIWPNRNQCFHWAYFPFAFSISTVSRLIEAHLLS